MLQRDRQCLIKIREYCEDIQTTISRYGASFEIFQEDRDYQQSTAFCVLQIGELVGKLSEDYRNATKEHMPWPQIKGMRNIVVHDYESLNIEIMWSIITKNILELQQFCDEQLAGME